MKWKVQLVKFIFPYPLEFQNVLDRLSFNRSTNPERLVFLVSIKRSIRQMMAKKPLFIGETKAFDINFIDVPLYRRS